MSGKPAATSVALAITGASGALYAVRTLAELLTRGLNVELVVSDYGRRLLRDELGEDASLEKIVPYLSSKYGPGVADGSLVVHSNRDLGATIASGSHNCSAMAVVPCSMKTLAGIAHGLSRNLVERAADEPAGAEEHGVVRGGRSDDRAGDAGVLPAAPIARRPCRFHGRQDSLGA